ncbi:MAG TPA: hypothetical protein VJ978_06030 [Nitriliruptoraceae bacterium]|nr:hypothetical protein [Nitriliruptoraceae bacterium]
MEQDSVAAPGLLEVAQTRWDLEREPVVTWDRDGRRFFLADPGGDERIQLAGFPSPVGDPRSVATALADTLASCDFPPTDDHASVPRVTAALAAAGHRDLADLVTAPETSAGAQPTRPSESP